MSGHWFSRLDPNQCWERCETALGLCSDFCPWKCSSGVKGRVSSVTSPASSLLALPCFIVPQNTPSFNILLQCSFAIYLLLLEGEPPENIVFLCFGLCCKLCLTHSRHSINICWINEWMKLLHAFSPFSPTGEFQESPAGHVWSLGDVDLLLVLTSHRLSLFLITQEPAGYCLLSSVSRIILLLMTLIWFQ